MRLHFYSFILGLLAVWGLWGCQTSRKLTNSQEPAASSDVQLNYKLVYVIHGDANYLYHDEDGHSLQADEQKVKEAITVARQARHGEVFIFHQRPEKKILWLFPQKDRLFLHYRSGELIHKKNYSPESSTQAFTAEKRLYHQYEKADSTRVFFLFFGHEIPPSNSGITYYQSRPKAQFDTERFARGVQGFLKGSNRFDLTMLSTCDNGTPRMVSNLQTVTRYLLASPQNLHLSHIDTQPLLKLETSPRIPASKLADSLAQHTYDRLSGFIQTAVTLSVYDMQIVGDYVGRLSESYQDYRRRNSNLNAEGENTDCTNLSFWDGPIPDKGVGVFYKAPNFGHSAGKESHTGWGCQQ